MEGPAPVTGQPHWPRVSYAPSRGSRIHIQPALSSWPPYPTLVFSFRPCVLQFLGDDASHCHETTLNPRKPPHSVHPRFFCLRQASISAFHALLPLSRRPPVGNRRDLNSVVDLDSIIFYISFSILGSGHRSPAIQSSTVSVVDASRRRYDSSLGWRLDYFLTMFAVNLSCCT